MAENTMMKQTLKTTFIRFLLFFALMALVITVQARAGGGFSGGRGGGSFGGGYGYGHYYYGSGSSSVSPFATRVIMVVTLCFTALFFFAFSLLLVRSRQKARKKLEHAQTFDQFWNEEKMKNHVREIFPKIQSAWMSRELITVSDIVTPKFIGTYQPLLNHYKRKKMLNIIDQVSIEKINIVDVHDDQDNTKDRFAAYIKGSMVDYLAHESQGITGTIAHAGIEGFEDLYIFKRKENTWLLDHIVNEPETRDFKLKRHSS